MRRVMLAAALILGAASAMTAQAGPVRAPRAPSFSVDAGAAEIAVGALEFQVAVSNPTVVEFAPSPDDAVIDHGVAVVASYAVEVYNAGTLAKTTNIGKPTPVAGKITYLNLATDLAALPIGSAYTVKVAAVGPGGTGRSTDSDPFGVTVRAPAATAKPVVR